MMMMGETAVGGVVRGGTVREGVQQNRHAKILRRQWPPQFSPRAAEQ